MATETTLTADAPYPRIPDQHAELWRKVKEYQFDKPGAPYPFSQKLKKRNKWNDHAFALRVIEEYRKFLYLTQTCPYMCTPSLIVDEAWHLHLQYTDMYWIKMCRDIFGRALHHHPGDGSDEDKEKFAAIYERTLDDYTKVFGTPPEDIWGKPNPSIDWRAICAKLPVPRIIKDNLMELFAPAPSEEAP